MKIILLLLILFCSTLLFADSFPPAADLLTLDHAFHDVGKVWQVITNMGYLGHHCYTTYAPRKKCEYPIGSGSSYLYGGSILVAGKLNEQKILVLTASSPSDEAVEKIKSLGVKNVLNKPIDPQVLLELLKN